MQSSMKRSRTKSGEEEDRISRLPDELLCKILSLLPGTKYAFCTSILSRRWIDLWTKVPVLHFEFHNDREKPDVLESFIRFVGKVLSRNVTPVIQKFRLHYDNFDYIGERNLIFRINDWVQVALLRQVVELDLQLEFCCESCPDLCACQDVGLWLHNMNRFSLHVLNLNLCVPLRMPHFMCFDNLKKFHGELASPDNELTSKLLSSVPKLEELSISIKEDVSICSEINIIAPVLKVLALHIFGWSNEKVLKILISAPMLENISISHSTLHSYTFQSIASNIQAKIDVGEYSGSYYEHEEIDHGIKLITGLSRAKSLSVSQSTLWGIFRRAANLPLFHDLTKLQLFLDPDVCNILPRIFRKTPKLKILILDMEHCVGEEYNFNMWQTCSMVHLKEVEIRGQYRRTKIQGMKLLKYIMKNAEYLEKFTLNSVQLF